MVDLDFIGTLAVSVDAAVALLHAVRVPWDLVVDEPGAVVLQVDALGGRVGGEEDAHGALLRIVLEGRLHRLALLGVHAAVEERHALAPEPFVGEAFLQPLLGRPVLGEDDDAGVGPGTTGADGRLQPVEEHPRLGVWPNRGALSPLAHLAEQPGFLVGRVMKQPGRAVDRATGSLLGLVVVGVLLVEVGDLAPQHAARRRLLGLAVSRGLQGLLVAGERRGERGGAGEQVLL